MRCILRLWHWSCSPFISVLNVIHHWIFWEAQQTNGRKKWCRFGPLMKLIVKWCQLYVNPLKPLKNWYDNIENYVPLCILNIRCDCVCIKLPFVAISGWWCSFDSWAIGIRRHRPSVSQRKVGLVLINSSQIIIKKIMRSCYHNTFVMYVSPFTDHKRPEVCINTTIT